jgi:hypothetical protein
MIIKYENYNPRGATAELIEHAVAITEEYRKAGFDMTLRQLYYQFVARDLIPNSQKSYNKIGQIVRNARMGGMMSWETIVDRTRNLKKRPHWLTPSALLEQSSTWYGEDCWSDQPNRVEVWIEKDALVGVIEGVCERNDCPYFSCRGYTSMSEVWTASQRMLQYMERGQQVHIIHLGDHDPSGIDMTRDIHDRLDTFMHRWHLYNIGEQLQVHRIALNMNQVEEYSPPPNPTKMTDSRCGEYIARHGYSSWELDALDPRVIDTLIQTKIDELRDNGRWNNAIESEQAGKDRLKELAVQEQGEQ